jgi:DNA polymerase III delta subunit
MVSVMGNTVVIGVRVPRWVKEELERLGINYNEEIRRFLLNQVKEKKMRELAEKMDKIRKRAKVVKGNLSAEVVRESRDEGWSR